jgi:RNA polymerase sigma-70 factor (ECF subfamily)
MSALLRAFQKAAADATAPATYDTAELGELLAASYARGQRAYPKLRVGEEAFARRLSRFAGAATGRWLDTLAAEDFYLACACAEGVRGAAAAFEVAYAKVIRKAVSRLAETRAEREDAEQRVLQHLLVSGRGGDPAIARYSGNVALARWTSVVAIRTAISLKRSETAERKLREKAGAEALGVSPEHLYMREELRREVEPAVAQALRRLADRDRLILRLYLVAGMSLAAIGQALGVSQQAISKRLTKAREGLLADVRANVAKRLKISEDEFSSILRFVASQLDVNVSRAFRAK